MDKKVPDTIGLVFKQAPPEFIDAGAQFSFSVLPKWPERIQPGDATYSIREGETPVHSGELPWSEAGDGSVVFALNAPEDVGEHRWIITVTRPEKEGHEHAEGSLPLNFTTIPHATSLAVWDNPSPVVRGRKFNVKAGAKCTASCRLGGRIVEIRDETDKVIGSGPLGDAPWEKTASLYWTEISLKAPRKLGLHSWTVAFSPAELKLPHGSATSRFSFVTVAEPAHSVSVKVVNKTTKAPIAGAQVRLGLYRTVTDEKGAARVAVPKGEFPLIVTRAGYKDTERSIDVSKDVRVRIGAEALPEEDPFAHWTA